MEWLLIGGALILVLRGAGANLSGILPGGLLGGGGSVPGRTGGADPGVAGQPSVGAPAHHMNDTAPGAGTVTIGGKPSGAGWNPHAGIAATTSQFAGIGAGLAGSLGQAGAFGASFAGSAAAAAIPIVGIGAMVVTTVLSIIHAHHAAALAREGKVLNETDPAMLNAMVMVAQATIAGEINSVSEAKTHTDQIVADWYAQVKSIQRGKWPYTASDFAKGILPDNVGPGTNNSGKRVRRPGIVAPDPCNGACYIGHYWVERTSFVVLDTVQKILAGQHGVMVLLELPAHETQQGFPEIRMQY